MPKTIILSLGGSLIVPDSIDADFLANLKKTIERYINKGYKFVIYCGGGKLARNVQQAASKITRLGNDDLDWLGIHATKLNAQLIKAIFKDNAESTVLENPTARVIFKKKVLVAAGWLPGWSTDYDAVLLAKNLRINEIINMSNIDYVYDNDPRKHKGARKIEKISWEGYRKLISQKWKAGMNVPFDPVAAKEAQKSGMKVHIIGSDLRNFENFLEGNKFRGTVIE